MLRAVMQSAARAASPTAPKLSKDNEQLQKACISKASFFFTSKNILDMAPGGQIYVYVHLKQYAKIVQDMYRKNHSLSPPGPLL